MTGYPKYEIFCMEMPREAAAEMRRIEALLVEVESELTSCCIEIEQEGGVWTGKLELHPENILAKIRKELKE